MSLRAAIAAGAVALAFVVGTSSAVAEPPEPANEEHFVAGSAKNRLVEFGGPVQLEVSAHLHRDATVTGHARGAGTLVEALPGTAFQVTGEVTCVRIVPKPMGGAYASVKYRYRSASPPLEEGGGVEVYIEDNGDPVGGRPVDANGTGPPMSRAAFEPRVRISARIRSWQASRTTRSTKETTSSDSPSAARSGTTSA